VIRSTISLQKPCKQAAVNQEFIYIKPLLLHRDGKLQPDITGSKETVDRTAVLVIECGEEMLLGVPKIGHGTGIRQAKDCLAILDKRGIRQQVCGLVLDITASNTRLKNGACTNNHWDKSWLGWLAAIMSWTHGSDTCKSFSCFVWTNRRTRCCPVQAIPAMLAIY